ncbi:MAG: DNA gyrase/topoisomerase IV subunit A [Deltaproteobacteria bacterium]
MENFNPQDKIISLKGMYKDYFLDYASYVILERAVPSLEDGLKPVQRRILHSMYRMDDGRYHKVANIIGHTMQFHPHGDAAIGDALVNLGQKDLLIDTQGNWGDIRTGDSAAAPRYIEARLTKFALEVAFNPQTTEWQQSYDGRNKEPVHLPMKFPLVLAQGVEGIAVGLSTKILPHNFIELIDASVCILKNEEVVIYPDFQTGGKIDISEYKDGERGGKVKVRAKIDILDKKTLIINELPYGVTTETLIDSVLKAVEKGKIKIKKITDNTAKNVEIEVQLLPGISPEVTRDALYAFTDCEVSISPNACVIVNNKPEFLTVLEILKLSTFRTKELLRQELEIKKNELLEKWHLTSLEKIFIENRIYRDIEEAESFETALEIIDIGLRKYVATPSELQPADKRLKLMREITQDDLIKLTEIKIKKISKYNSFKTDEYLAELENELKQVNYDLKHLTEFTIKYFEHLKKTYGTGRERRTEIINIETIATKNVIVNNAKLYIDPENGFIGTNSKIGDFVCECSDIDDIIAFRQDGKCIINRIGDKVFMGKNLLHAGLWKKDDERTTYHLIYLDGNTGNTYAKRFQVNAITRDKEYNLITDHNFSKVLYFSVNPNGETEIVKVFLTPGCKAKNKVFDFDFGNLMIKGRSSLGNTVTKYPVKKVSFLEKGKSSLGKQKYWYDEITGKLNKNELGKYLGQFDTEDKIIVIYKSGHYEIKEVSKVITLDYQNITDIHQLNEDTVITAVHYDGDKQWSMVKRFKIETNKVDEKFLFISEHKDARLYFVSFDENPIIKITYIHNKINQEKELNASEIVGIKGWKAMGNKIGEFTIKSIEHTNKIMMDDDTASEEFNEEEDYSEEENNRFKDETTSDTNDEKSFPDEEIIEKKETKNKDKKSDNSLHIGDTIEF